MRTHWDWEEVNIQLRCPQTQSGKPSLGEIMGESVVDNYIIWRMSGQNIWGILSTMDSNPRCYMHLWCRFSFNSGVAKHCECDDGIGSCVRWQSHCSQRILAVRCLFVGFSIVNCFSYIVTSLRLIGVVNHTFIWHFVNWSLKHWKLKTMKT